MPTPQAFLLYLQPEAPLVHLRQGVRVVEAERLRPARALLPLAARRVRVQAVLVAVGWQEITCSTF